MAAEVCSWVDLNKKISRSLNTGYRKNDKINGEVHDPNAFVVKERSAHAGIFSTVNGLGQTLLNFNEQGDLIKKISDSKKGDPGNRFQWGWDTENSFMGSKASEGTFAT